MYELKSAYGQVVRRRPTVADLVYPEILKRILNKPDLVHEDDLKNQIITVYQIIQYHEVGNSNVTQNQLRNTVI